MQFRLFLIILTLISIATSPLHAAKKQELIPAPEVELEAIETRKVEDILAELKRKIVKERPSSARVVYGWFKSAGNAIGAHSNIIYVLQLCLGRRPPIAAIPGGSIAGDDTDDSVRSDFVNIFSCVRNVH